MAPAVVKLISELDLEFTPQYCNLRRIAMILGKRGDMDLIFPVIEREGRVLVLDMEAEFLAAKARGITHVRVRYVNHEDLMAFRLNRLQKEIGERPHPLDTAAYLAEQKRIYSLTDADLASRLCLSRSEISKYVAIHEHICPKAKEAYRELLQFCFEHPTDHGHTKYYKSAERIGKDHLYSLTLIRANKENRLKPELQAELQKQVITDLCERHLSVKDLNNKIHELLKTYKKKLKPKQHSYKSIVYAGDNRDMLSVQKPESVDLVLTSPPFGFPKAAYDTARTVPELLDAVVPGLQLAAIALKPGCHAFINIANWQEGGRTINLVADLEFALWEVGLTYKEEITWDKGYLKTRDASPKTQTHTHYSCLPNSELILHFVKGGPPREISSEDSEMAKRQIRDAKEVDAKLRSEWSDNFRRIIYFQPSHKHVYGATRQWQGDVGRCAMPDQMASWYIRAYSVPGDTILDPYAGTCTTLKMAEREGRIGIGFERNPRQITLLEKEGLRIAAIKAGGAIQTPPSKWRDLVSIRETAGFYRQAACPIALPILEVA